VTENLENAWTGAVHRKPLQAFFARQIERVTAEMAA
jgi:hypothetical protein